MEPDVPVPTAPVTASKKRKAADTPPAEVEVPAGLDQIDEVVALIQK